VLLVTPVLKRLAIAAAGLFIFILALWLLKEGALGLKPLMARLQVSGLVNALGFGWLMAYLVLSGSPVAAVSLTLFGGRLLSSRETFAMITGSRLGASFIVLFVGFIYWLRGQQRTASISTGILSLLVTATIYLPAMMVGNALLRSGWLDGMQMKPSGEVVSIFELVYDPIVDFLSTWLGLPNLALFALGMGVLLAAFHLFDKALPEIDPESSRFSRIAELVYRPIFMVLLGAGITTITLSVSVSLSLLVPLSAKGYIRRENIIPYIMGANVTTFIDTLLAALLIPARSHEPSAFMIVLVQMLSVTLVSLAVLVGPFYLRYQRLLGRVMEWIVGDNRTLAVFLGVIFVIPLILLLV
jgi:sodium-dependent phosphate cotransporter